MELKSSQGDKGVNRYRIVYIDAFTDTPFTGNPCAVIQDATRLTDEQMQAIARETNLPETSFVFPSERADFRVRYFTPSRELPFAGHPTLATAFTLAQEGRIPILDPVTRLRLEFDIGVLPVDIHITDGRISSIVMTQLAPTFGKTFSAAETAPCLSLELSDLRSDCPPQVVSTGVAFLIVPVNGIQSMKKAHMNREALGQLCTKAGVSSAFLFCIGGYSADTDTHARLFDPNSPIEDPFTGSATGCMGAYVVYYGLQNGPQLLAEQGHFVNRPGKGTLEILGPPTKIEAVKLGGSAVKVLDGNIYAY